MKQRHFGIIILLLTVLLFAFFIVCKKAPISEALYGEYIAPIPISAKFVQIQPVSISNFTHRAIIIETLGYREIRVYLSLFADDYKMRPLTQHSTVTLGFSHELSGLGVPYADHAYKSKVLSYIDGWATEHIYGNKLKLGIAANNLPEGQYTLHLSYYLLP